MIERKGITKIISAVMAAAVILCLCAVAFSDSIAAAAGDTGVAMEYETALFDTDEIITINIRMDEADWNDMLQNAAAEEYRQCDVEINGTTFYSVAIRPKGNTSLTSIANDPTTDRYSFKLEFDRYVSDQSCFGLDKLVLNNGYADATNMKEALIYDMFRYLGADASLYNYAEIYVNGEYWGVYLALEAVEDSFLLRSYGVKSGELYKPEGLDFGGGGGFSMSGGGANLNYTDDAAESYQTIWDGAVTDSSDAGHERVITALRNIAEGNDLETYMDTDNLLRYMAVHIFSVNEDSLSGSMAHNYYLYESDGRLNILPWDYNLALGGMGGGSDASEVVNSAIDDAFSGTDFFDTLLADEEYHARYYAYLRQLVTEYVSGGGFDAFYERVRRQIDALVESDPTAFYSYEEYLTAADTLYQTVQLRAKSIAGQLDGTIPSTEAEQRGSDALIDASALELRAMGYMNAGGGGMPDGGGDMPNGFDVPEFDGNMPSGDPPDGFEPSEFGGGKPGGFDASQSGGDAPEENKTPPSGNENQSGFDSPQSGGDMPGGFDSSAFGSRPDVSSLPGGSDASAASASGQTLALYGVSLLVMTAAMLFAVFYRRKPKR